MKIPKFKLETTGGETLTRDDLEGKITVLYFYPKANTPGCTTEGQDFTKKHAAFKKLGAQVFGISRDLLKAQSRFKDKFEFQFELVSDPEDILGKAFDVIKMKNMYGKKFEGIERSTFILDKQGQLVNEWRKVKVAGHVDEVLKYIKEEM